MVRAAQPGNRLEAKEGGWWATSSSYVLGDQLQKSHRATLYRAVRAADGRPVVLKVLDPRHSRTGDSDRLRNEYELGRTLKGLSVVEPLALSSFQGMPALELEAFAGRSLEQLVGQPMAIDAFLRLALRIANVVSDIHGRGLIHKDLKPENILLDQETGEIKIADFCISSRAAREQTAARPTRLIEGSLPYVSPEQTGRMSRSVDSRSDLYSLGVTFYQLLTGRLPFEAADAIGWVHCHVARRPIPPVLLRPSIPEVVSDIILKLLAKVPDDRYQSAAGLAHDLARALGEWRRNEPTASFALGERDASDRFLIPQRLYGRARERAVLEEAFERVVATGVPELVLVSGSSGIGKSSVVNELHRPVVSRRGVFVTGKFEQYRRDDPYFSVVRAFREILLDIVAEGPDSIAAWQARILAALKTEGQIVIDLIPELGLILGPQPPVPELSLSEAENRLQRVLRDFLSAFATPEHPLAVFFDDLQWADPASLKLLVDLMVHPTTRHLLLLGAYRDSEVDATHPLRRALGGVRAAGAAVHKLVLGPLESAHVHELVADTLHGSLAEVAPLAHLVREKTGGNPFFVIQFLTALHRQELIAFDPGERRWRWDLTRIQAQGYTDNVVELMVGNLHDLPADTQEALKVAACLGASVDADTLRLVLGREPEIPLRAALEEDLLLQRGDTYRFPHDRVQEAAHALIPEGEREAMHLRIGRLLLARTPPVELDDKIFDVVNQFNQAAPLITSPAEQGQVAELNLQAGKRAQRSTAYASALRYFLTGAAILGEERWARRPDLAFGLEIRWAECELVTRDLDAAEQHLGALVDRAANPIDAAAIACLQSDLYTTSGRLPQAVDACLAYLRWVGIDWAAHPSDVAVRDEFARMWQLLGSRQIEALIDLPEMTDPVWRAVMDVFAMFTAPASFTDENLCCLAVARAVNLSLEHGNAEGSSQLYVLVGEILGTNFDNYAAAARFGKLGFDLLEKRGPLRLKPSVYFCFAQMVNCWIRPFRSSIELQHRAFEVAEQTGNLQTASYARNALVTLRLAAGDPLRDVERTAEDGLAYIRFSKFHLVGDVLGCQLRLIRTLRGVTPAFGSFNGDGFDEAEFERRVQSHPGAAIAAGWYWIRKLQGRFFAGDYRVALDAARSAEPFLWTARAFPEMAEYHFFAALAQAAVHDTAPSEAREEHLRALLGHHRQLKVWAASCPENFDARATLVAAELARLRGEREAAMGLYEEAIRSAREGGFVHNEALAFESASRFYRGLGRLLIADTYLREARDLYLRWGADGKARALEQRSPSLVEPKPPGPSTTIALQAEQLDVLSVVKASQTISGVMVRQELLRTLLRLVLEEGGARRALVLLSREGRFEVASEVRAETEVENGSDEPLPLRPPGADVEVPDSLLAYVQRTHERVLLDDAAEDAGRFSSDPYLVRTGARSVLCFPIRRQAEVVALLYLENDLVPGAFTPDRLLALELLAAQAAISLENALLLERERAARAEAEAAERRARLLDEATAVMASSLDYQGVFGALTEVCVRTFADWAIIDLLEDGRTVRLAGAHRDPGKEPLLRELAQHYPAGAGSAAPATSVLESGEPLLLTHISDASVRAVAVDEQHAGLIGRLGTRSAIVVPLVARDVRLGALTLASESPGGFGPADLEVASEIGRRAALAIDNARLLFETQRAVRLRDDFLSVASHELRTPITSLKMTVERLLLRSGAPGEPISPESFSNSLSRVKHSAERLRHLTDELLDVTRIEHGRLDLLPSTVDLGALVRQVVDDLQVEVASAGSEIRIDAETVVGVWDPSRLEQVITNLLTNALKFGPKLPIDIRLRGAGNAATVSVQDHGIGIEPSHQESIFDRFERAVSSTHYGGLGLGLYIARRIARAHGGDLRVESQPGRGATFTLTLPGRIPR